LYSISAYFDCDARAQKVQRTMTNIRSHRDLEAWQVSMDLVIETYDISESFPAKEMYGLQSQMRPAAVSVPSNIAEGQARPLGACINHLSISAGSLAELDTQLEVALRCNYVSDERIKRFRQLHEGSRRLVYGLKRAKQTRLATDVASKTGVLVLIFYALSHVLR
jgi:four helix bundle protein